MSVPAAYIAVIIVWTTTPLAIRWSVEGAGVWESAALRMTLGAFVAGNLLALMGRGLRLNRTTVPVYLISGFSIFMAMGLIYWAAARIPSGWISVIFGLVPIATGLFAAPVLGERIWVVPRIAGLLLGVIGLAVVFLEARGMAAGTARGIVAVVLAVLIHAGSSVWIKSLGVRIPALAVTTGGLWVAAPLLLLAWALSGDGVRVPDVRSAAAISYLGIIGSVLGFSLYYYVLKHVEAVRVALITLITPISALFLGHLLAAEPLTARVLLGTSLVILGLVAFESRILLGHVRARLRGRGGGRAPAESG
ncbi:MAG: DMT family transporter [Gammaproteobacteria bacterium]